MASSLTKLTTHMRYAISYVSTVNPELSETEIQKALDFSKNWNNDNNITGILLYSQGNFFQVLEGEENLLKSLFSRIKADQRHHNVITIFQKKVPNIQFDDYEVDFISLDDSYNAAQIDTYLSQIDLLNPSIQGSVRYILNKFTEGIK
ncbi:BLUF domain-containing protein [Autumnicola psychrophila]|uniref:BLUF domain-containing protein n=1 Tax=Autumnicola psychrophila TaxID=3075592 RepID=A0ABU3DMK7_9FLAO|nr:BLUF domain-containing protein [Zunongwangia sp. F225]MDT0684955.1 BLUF domain-containing protein [Zunongwangia sp. F225]